MRKKKLFIAATALLALVSCTSNTYLGDQEALRGDVPISFDMSSPALTRTDKAGGEAASDLNNNFVVFGYKTMSDDSKQTVFTNYQANYVANTAYTTASNSANWEYVGYKNLAADMKEHEGVAAFSAKTGSGEANKAAIDQTIKYWDFSATNYKFYAYSLGTGKTGSSTTWANASLMSNNDTYTLQGDQEQLSACYISELLTVDNPSGSTPTEVNLRFLTIKSKLQLGFYETIPGYSVKELKFYATSGAGSSTTTPALYQDYTAPAEPTLPKAGTYTVTFDENGKPQLAWAAAASDGTQANVTFDAIAEEQLKTREYKEIEITPGEKLYLGRSSNTASMTAVKEVLPYAVGADLTLKVDYTLVSRDNSGETIKAVGATAVVPAAFTQWKPNYKYTYLFKISDKSNPLIGGVEGLYPITLDAVVAAEQGGSQETITTISEPSITTYAKESAVLSDNEYKTGNNIYAVVEDYASNPTLTVGTNAKLYFVTLDEGADQEITELSVGNALVNGTPNATDKTWTVTDASSNKMVVTDTETSLLTAFTSIPAEDSPTGIAITVKGAKFTPAVKYVAVESGKTLTNGAKYYTSDAGAGEFTSDGTGVADGTNYFRKTSEATGSYVIEYSRDAQGGNPYIQATGKFVTGTKYYTDDTGETEVNTSGFTEGSTDVSTYYIANPEYKPAVKIYKVIRVVPAP